MTDPSHHMDSSKRKFVTNNKDGAVLLHGKLMRKVSVDHQERLMIWVTMEKRFSNFHHHPLVDTWE